MTETPYFSTLKKRGQLKVSGDDRKSFLQGLISNDITLLEQQDCIYTCLLTPQGKFLYDFFITESGNALYLDCEGSERAQNLAKLLMMYKLRADIDIEIIERIPVYAVFYNTEYGHKDPRHEEIGYRSFEKPNLPEKNFDHWDKHRISLTIPDGSRDMILQKSTLLECHIDKLNGLSWDKGCYVGQELTARMHYRGLAKKHLYTVTAKDLELDELPSPGTTIEKGGITIGDMRSSCKNIGLALLKDEHKDKFTVPL